MLHQPTYILAMASQFRYSKNSFQRSVVTALGLTAILSFLIWLFARLFGLRYADEITVISGLIFFGFCSAAMIYRYLKNDIIVAIRPDGLFDSRYSSQAVPWDEIKAVNLARAENDFELGVDLWPRKQGVAGVRFTMDLAPLDGTIDDVLQAVAAHKPIAMEER